MSRKIGIIGMGNVGAAVAHGAIAQGSARWRGWQERFPHPRTASATARTPHR